VLFSFAVGQQRTARTSTGFYYPLNSPIASDRNWLACGASYYANTRHIGSDLIFGVGTRVYAVAAGTVIYKSGPNQSSGWGIGNYALVIRHSAKTGDFLAVYGHIHTSLTAGSKVIADQEIGTVGRYYELDSKGKTVESTPHLHFGVFPSVANFPLSGWGRITDTGCKKPSLTNGFVAPISWITTKTPK
jgi:murein DD-endopeptidase MepM/ murein hydrolase activator NlpD